MSIHDRYPFVWKESRKKATEEKVETKVVNVLKSEVAVLDLKTRSYNALKRGAINTIGDLIDSWDRLPRTRNVGETSIKEIKAKLRVYLIANNETELLERIG